MIVTVAKATAQSPRAVMREPAAATLWTFYELDDMTRVETQVREMERFDQARKAALAQWSGKDFQEEATAFHGKLRRHPNATVEPLIVRPDGFFGTLHPVQPSEA